MTDKIIFSLGLLLTAQISAAHADALKGEIVCITSAMHGKFGSGSGPDFGMASPFSFKYDGQNLNERKVLKASDFESVAFAGEPKPMKFKGTVDVQVNIAKPIQLPDPIMPQLLKGGKADQDMLIVTVAYNYKGKHLHEGTTMMFLDNQSSLNVGSSSYHNQSVDVRLGCFFKADSSL